MGKLKGGKAFRATQVWKKRGERKRGISGLPGNDGASVGLTGDVRHSQNFTDGPAKRRRQKTRR